MNILKSIIIALSLILPLGAISSNAFAAGPPSAESSVKNIDSVIAHANEAIQAIDADESQKQIRVHIKEALRVCKEITGAEALEKRRLKYSRLLKKARSAIKKGDMQDAKEFLIDTAEKFETLKKLI